MRTTYRPSKYFCLGILFIAQVWLACQLAFTPFNAVKVTYRREERAAALKAEAENPSPTTRAALQEEIRLAARHVHSRQFASAGVIFVSLVGFDLLCIYAWRRIQQKPVQLRQ